ncbi:gas vesicle protein GvpO [Salibacterium aidingense]|uniref:gas vesicle protein GvpO n=1 Tax=Salibacterium aidingense TaxID=384933 RepID=UPI00040BDA55|nr:gas vesicle protein GvpO [Salibacterium aidingense]
MAVENSQTNQTEKESSSQKSSTSKQSGASSGADQKKTSSNNQKQKENRDQNMGEVFRILRSFFTEHIAPPFRITSIVNNEENGWEAEVEVIEEKEYMKTYAKDQLLGVYEVALNNKLEIISFDRIKLRPRTALVDKNEGRQ